MAAAAIHHVDLARASGSFYLGPPPLPSVLGNDGVGRLPDGRRVFVDSAVVPFGTWAERALAGTDSLLDVADGVDDVTAAALANTGLTAWLALTWRAPVQPGRPCSCSGRPGPSARSRRRRRGCWVPDVSWPPCSRASARRRERTRS